MSRPLCALFVLLFAQLALGQAPLVRVLLERTTGSVTVSMGEAHQGYLGDDFAFRTPLPLDWPVDASGEALEIDGLPIYQEFTLLPESGVVEWRGRRYRGGLRLAAAGDELLIINVLALDDYLRGVVPSEMMGSWPIEALKAQAVASRSYTLASLDAEQPFDVCATVECQVYGGMDAEDPRTDIAVAETAGQVLVHSGELVKAYYHSDSGGVTASSGEVWGEIRPYLHGRADVAAITPHRDWVQVIDGRLLGDLLAGHGIAIGVVRAVSVNSYTESGRAARATFEGSGGRATVAGALLTSILRGAGLKSTRFRMVDALTARGDGWGHGVGMSQYGARQLALNGYSFDRILAFYYQDASLAQLRAVAGVDR